MGACAGDLSDKQEITEPFKNTGGQVWSLIVALNYHFKPEIELTCSKDAEAMVRMLKRAEVHDENRRIITDLHFRSLDDVKTDAGGKHAFPTKNMLIKAIRDASKRCQPGDWFLWFYAGHGVNVPDHDGDEADGLDEAFGTVGRDGRLCERSVLIDDDFAECLDTVVPQGVRILCICDCCHSGTICDIDTYKYNHDIYQISASQDDEEAEDTGRGGVLTESLRRTIGRLSWVYGDTEFSIRTVFDGCVKRARKMTKAQELSLQFSGPPPEVVAWPLCFEWTRYLQPTRADLEEDGADSVGSLSGED